MLFLAAAPVVTAVKGAAVGAALGEVKTGIAQVFGAPTPTVANALARIASLKARALAGDDAAVIALCYEAFEKRTGAPGDPRSPVDGKASPEDARTAAKRALNAYVTQYGALPPAAAQWAVALNAPVAPTRATVGEQLFGAIEAGVAQGAQSAAQERITTAARSALPYVIGGVVVVAAIVAVVFASPRK
jgi:hypothetical protein